jgi:hypothetical protein
MSKNKTSIYMDYPQHVESLDAMDQTKRDKVEESQYVEPDIYKDELEDENYDINADITQIMYVVLDSREPLVLCRKLYELLYTIANSTKHTDGQRIMDSVKLKIYLLHMSGKSSREIAKVCNMSHAGVQQNLKKMNDKLLSSVNMFTKFCAKD